MERWWAGISQKEDRLDRFDSTSANNHPPTHPPTQLPNHPPNQTKQIGKRKLKKERALLARVRELEEVIVGLSVN